MRVNNFFKQSKKIKKNADWILDNSCVLKMLKKYGSVNPAGAYRLDLMMDGDIDIHVLNPKMTKEKAVEALNRFIKLDYFKACLFYDFIKYKKDGFPKGYCVELKKPLKGRNWNIDIWFVKNDKESDRFMSEISKKMDDDTRIAVLRLEEWRNRMGLKIRKSDIYREVVKKPRTLKAYKKILVKKI